MEGINGKVILITGGNSGIGKATAIELAKAGCKVSISGRREAEGTAVVKEIEQAGGIAMFVKMDVTKEEEVKTGIEKTIETFGSLDFAFNNAGVHFEHKPLHSLTEDMWDTIVDINMKGVWLSMKHEINYMLQQGHGAIVNMSSMGGLVGNPVVLAPYIAAKHGVIGLTKSAALEYATNNIRVNALSPAIIQTPMLSTLPEESIEPLRMAHPMQRLGTVKEVASAVMWLCSEGSGFVTGHTIPIDGGYYAQ